jgi:protein phosphatase slingshot
MKTVDLDSITTKSIRLRLEEDMQQRLEELKAFIDEEILLILGQMDPASKIFDFLYLGSEWNASNLEELNANGITHILNVTREIDNFFPAVFKYLNIREYDVEETDLLKYWDETYNFIQGCIQMGGRVLVHCKMGISRSASTVCSFAMKHFRWSLDHALRHTKECRDIINPNVGFRHQLHVYEGILEASRQRNTFRRIQRSKSDGADIRRRGGRGAGRGLGRRASQEAGGRRGARGQVQGELLTVVQNFPDN